MEVQQLDKNVVQEYIAKFVAGHFGSNVQSIKYLGSGSFGMAYKVIQDKEPSVFVAKAYKIDGMCTKEAFDINLLGENSLIKYPKIYLQTRTEGFDLLLMEYIEGKNVFESIGLLLKSKKWKRLFAEKVVDSLAYTHSKINDKFGDIREPKHENWLDYYKPFAVKIYEQAQVLKNIGKYGERILATMDKAMANFDSIFDEDVAQASLIHGDLNVMNIMANKGEITAIIDPLNAMYADKEYDLFQFNNLTGKWFGFYKLYKEKYTTSTNCDVKCAFYALWNEVYCYIKAGTMIKFIMSPLLKNMEKELAIL